MLHEYGTPRGGFGKSGKKVHVGEKPPRKEGTWREGSAMGKYEKGVEFPT